MRIVNLQKMETSDNITKELAELALLCTEIKERAADHQEMEKGTYKEDKDFVSIFKGIMSTPLFHYMLLTLIFAKEWMRYTR